MRLLKNLFIFFSVLCAIYILLFVSLNLVFQKQIKGLIEKRLSALFGAEVNIKNFKTNFLTQIKINRIRIKTKTKLPFKLDVSALDFTYRPLYLFRNRLRGKIELKDLRASGANFKLQENISVVFSCRPRFFDKVFEIEEFTLYREEAPALSLSGSIEPIFKPRRAAFHIRGHSFSYAVFNLKGFNLNLNVLNDRAFGDCSVETLKFNKLSLSKINSKVAFKDKKMHLENLKADIFGGRVNADALIAFLPNLGYNLNLKLAELNLEDILSRLAPADWQATGIISGDLRINIEGQELKDLEGHLYSQRPGTVSMKVIKRLLSGASLAIDKDIFKEGIFFYENLTGDIALLKDDIIVKLALLGKKAELKFDLNIEPEVLISFLNLKG